MWVTETKTQGAQWEPAGLEGVADKQESREHKEDLEGLEDDAEGGAAPAPAPAWPAREFSVIKGFFKT